jgi:signal transduction histidine kinase
MWRGRKAVERELVAARQALENDRRELEEARRRLVTTVSHELRTPLTLIQGVVDTLATHWDRLAEHERLDLIDVIASNVSSLDASILHFIDVGQLARGARPLRVEHVALQPVVDAVLVKLAVVLGGHPVHVQLDVDDAWADRDAVARIVELLLANAVRFSELASPIHIRARAVAEGVELVVIDRGIGIDPRHLPHVFEPFWRADTGESGISRGAGLGLAIVKDLAELHGGNVRVLSSRGRGSAFHVLLPTPTAEAPDLPGIHQVG